MKKRTYKPFTHEDMRIIKLMNDEGKSNAEIAHVLCRTTAQIAQKKFHMNVKQKPKPGLPDHRERHKRRWTVDEVDDLRIMRFEKHMTIAEISKALGRSDVSVRAKLRDVDKEIQAYKETSVLWGMVKLKYPVR